MNTIQITWLAFFVPLSVLLLIMTCLSIFTRDEIKREKYITASFIIGAVWMMIVGIQI